MTNHGLIIVKPGANVLNPSINDIVLSSKYNTFNIFKEQQVNVTTNGSGDGSATLSHNLGYKPAFLSFSYRPWSSYMSGVSYYNPIFHCESGMYQHAYHEPNEYNHGIMVTSDTSNLNITVHAGANQTIKTYNYIFIDLAEETTLIPELSDRNYGLRIAQPGYDVLNSPDYRMILTSRYKMLQVLKTGTITVSANEVTLSDGQENYSEAVATFPELNIPDEVQIPYLYMAENKSLYTGNAIAGYLSYFALNGQYFYSSQDTFQASYNFYVTKHRIVGYIWRTYHKGILDPDTITYPACSVTFRYMLFQNPITLT